MHIATSHGTKWLGYSILCVFFWGAWATLEKVGSQEIAPNAVQFLFAFGGLPVALRLLFSQGFRLERNRRGVVCSLIIGVLAGIGNAALAAAYRGGGSTSVITVVTAMYPMLTVLLARLVLREHITRVHLVGLGFAAAAFVIFSL